MNRQISTSLSEQRTIMESLLRRVPGYAPEWSVTPGTKAAALLDVLARYRKLLDIGFRELPKRNLLAMLDMLAMPLLPAQAARVPVVFRLTQECPVDVTVAAESQLAAQPPPPSPSLLTEAPQNDPSPVLFFTEHTVTLARAKLTALYSIDPDRDTYADHSARLTDGCTVFGDMARTEHAIYLGHDRLFKLGGHEITLLLQCTLDAAPQKPLDVRWQYLSEVGWITLQLAEEEDTTRGLTRDGQIALRLNCGPDAKKETFHGRATYWIRGTLYTPVIRGENLRHNPLTVNDLCIRVQFKKKDVLPDAAFADAMRLDVSKEFYPFGQQPARFNVFYLSSAEVFQRGGAKVHIDIELLEKGVPLDSNTQPTMMWEFYGNGGWQKLGVEPSVNGVAAYKFDSDQPKLQRISFNCPTDWQESELNGTKNRWLRIRITSGGFKDATSLPVVSKLTLSYTYLTDPEPLDHCLTRNEFQFEDHTEDVRWPDRSFDPFWPVPDERPALHFGFDQRLPAGLVSLYAQVSGAEEFAPGTASAFTWEYLSRSGWLQLGVRDETHGLRQSGMVQFIGPPDAVAAPGLGGNVYRIRARLKDGVALTERALSGVWLNGVWAGHRVRVEQEMLGTADGTPRQALRFLRSPVLAGEIVEVREWAGRGEGWQLIARQVPEEDIRYEREPVSQKITAAWVRWRERPHLYDAQQGDRAYVLERATGLIRFGNGTQGMIPPAGSRIVTTYRSGGGMIGNVPRDSVTQLRSAVPFVANVTNPVAATGGAPSEPLEAIRDRGPQRLRHRDRAITASDIEWVARDASPEVARACCLALTGPVGHAQRGWMTVIVVPRSSEDRPTPSTELQRLVAEHLRARVPVSVMRRLRVIEPRYMALNIAVEIIPVDPTEAALVEAQVRDSLTRFLHPLAGGPCGNGWGFGEDVHLSNIAFVIESTTGVDYARDIQWSVDGGEQAQSVAVPRDTLICSGAHEIKLAVGVR